jgi:hypothetical protein
VEALAKDLSKDAQVYVPGDEPFAALTTRWSNLEPPSPSVVVVAAVDVDVSQTVSSRVSQLETNILMYARYSRLRIPS